MFSINLFYTYFKVNVGVWEYVKYVFCMTSVNIMSFMLVSLSFNFLN